MSDLVQDYLTTKYSSVFKDGVKPQTEQSGANTAIGALLTPFRWGQEGLTTLMIKFQNSNLSTAQAYDIATGDRAGKEWWQDGSKKVTTFGQALYNLGDTSTNVDYLKLKQQQAKFDKGSAKYISGGVDFLSSIFLDPANYLTFGTAVAAKKGVQKALDKFGYEIATPEANALYSTPFPHIQK